MGEDKSFFDKIFGGDKKDEEKKKKPDQKKNEFAEDEKTFDGVVRQLRSDLEKDNLVGPHKSKKK